MSAEAGLGQVLVELGGLLAILVACRAAVALGRWNAEVAAQRAALQEAEDRTRHLEEIRRGD